MRGIQSEAEAAVLRDMIDRSLAARDRIVVGAPHPGDDDWYTPSEPRTEDVALERRIFQTMKPGRALGMLAADAPLLMCELLAVYDRTGVAKVIRDLLDEPLALSVNKTVVRKVLRSYGIWHQDGSFMGPEARAVDMWLSLTHCGPGTDTPGLDIVPRRIEAILDRGTHGAWLSPIAIGEGLLEIVAGEEPWTTPRFAPGDAILFDTRFVHRTAGEGFTSERYVVETWFFSAPATPHPTTRRWSCSTSGARPRQGQLLVTPRDRRVPRAAASTRHRQVRQRRSRRRVTCGFRGRVGEI